MGDFSLKCHENDGSVSKLVYGQNNEFSVIKCNNRSYSTYENTNEGKKYFFW